MIMFLLRKRYNIHIVSLLFFSFLWGGFLHASPSGGTGPHGDARPPANIPVVSKPPVQVGDRLYWTPACPIIAQTFNNSLNANADVNGSTVDTSSVGWYLDASKVPNAAYFAIKSHRLKAQTLGGEGVWYSRVFNISGYTGVQFDTKISDEGSKSSSEYVKVSYKLDGGPETTDTVMYGNMGTPLVTSQPMTGHTLQIVVRIYDTTQGNSEYYIEQYDVFKEVGPCTVSGITVTASASNSGVLTCTNPSTTLSAATTATGTTTYSWTGPSGFTATGASVTATTAGTYTVTGTNSAGTGTATIAVTSNTTAPAGVTATVSGSLTCSTTSVTLTGSSTTSGTTFSWTGPNGFTATGATATATATGSYTLTATNPATGCTTAVSTTVTQITTAPAGVTATVSGSLTCSTTSVTLTGSSTTSGATFSWTGPNGFTATGATATATATGSYTLTATNPATGCTTAVSTTVTQNLTAPASVTASNNGPLTCNFTTATMSASSTTTSGVTYAWSGTGSAINYGATGATVTTTAPGTYILTATYTPTGCTTTAMTSVYLTNTTPGTVTASNNGPLTCSAPSVTLNGSSTLQQGVTYAWTGPGSFASTGTSATATVPGTYTLTATYTPTGCTATATTNVTGNTTAPTGVAIATANNVTQLTCSTTSITLLGSSTTTGATFNWSGPNGYTGSGATASATTGGTYIVTATNPASGCTATASVVITQNATPPANAAITPNLVTLTCSNPSATLTGSSSTPGVSYAWSGPNSFTATGTTATVISAGEYILTVTNPANGCASTTAATIATNFAPPASVTAVNNGPQTCSNVDVILTGSSTTSGTTFAWTGPNGFTATSATTNLTSLGQDGTYTLTATNPANGCTATTTTVVAEDDAAPTGVTVSSNAPSAVLNCTNTSLTLTASSSTPGVTYAWRIGPTGSTVLGTGASLTVSQPNAYDVLVTNPANGCAFLGGLTVTQNVTAPASVAVTTIPADAVLTCSNTSVALTGTSSDNAATYSWTGPGGFTGSSTAASTSTPGTYTLTATDPTSGCTATATTTITQNITPPAGVAISSNTGATVLNCTNPTLTLTGSSTTSGLNYSWSGPSGFTASSASAAATTPGAYTLTVTDPSNGCTATANSVLTQNTTAPGGVTTTAVPATAQITCDHPTVLLTGNSTTAGVTYSWNGPSVVSTTGATATVNGPGTYTVTVTDPTNGCVTAVPGSVTKNVSVPVGLTASPSDIISCFTPVIDLQGGSTTPDATFAWSGPGGYTANTADAETEMPGSYTLIVTNPANGCTASTSTVVLADTATPANVTASNNGPLNCINTSVTITSSSSTSGVDFTWVTPGNTFISGATAVVTVPGTYTIQVTNDENGCVSQATTTVIQNTTGCSGSTVATPGAISGRSMEGFSGDAVTGFVYKAYPNPFSTTAFVEFVSPISSPVRVEIYSTSGYREQLLFSSTVDANQVYKLQLTGLSSGTHFCVINNNGKVYTTKIVVIR